MTELSPQLLTTTPEVRLLRLREHCQRIITNTRHVSTAAVVAAQMFMALDASLCDNGVLPLDWTDAKRSLVINGLPKQPQWSGFGVPDALADEEDEPDGFVGV